MVQLRIAHHFRRPDVDAFLDELSLEDFSEWATYFAVEPQGWQATQLAVKRLAFVTAQAATPRRLKESDYAIGFKQRVAGEVDTLDLDKARAEAAALASAIGSGVPLDQLIDPAELADLQSD